MKTLTISGIVLVVLGLCAGFLPQVIKTLATGVPGSGIGWMQSSGFVVALIGAVLIGRAIGLKVSRRRAQRAEAARHDGTTPSPATDKNGR